MQPIVDRLRDEFEEDVAFVYLNANEAGKAAFQQLNMPGHPGYVLFSSTGEERYRSFGIVEEDGLRDELLSRLNE